MEKSCRTNLGFDKDDCLDDQTLAHNPTMTNRKRRYDTSDTHSKLARRALFRHWLTKFTGITIVAPPPAGGLN